MKLNAMFPSKFLKADDVGQSGAIYTIKAVGIEALGTEQEEKPVVRFRETPKGLVVNKTNAAILGELFGDDTDAWLGKRVALRVERVSFQGRRVDSIRVVDSAPLPHNEAGGLI